MTLVDDRTLASQAKWRPSFRLVALACVSLAAGIAFGGWLYVHRSSVRQHYVDGTSAWPPHIALAAVTAVAALVLVRRRGLAGGLRLVAAPVSAEGARRVRQTVRTASGAGGVVRLLLSLPPSALLLYLPFRMGMQVLGGLDPNFTVDAWGGPSYAGAMACHYLDAVPLAAAAMWLLDKVLLPGQLTGLDLPSSDNGRAWSP